MLSGHFIVSLSDNVRVDCTYVIDLYFNDRRSNFNVYDVCYVF